MSLVTVRTAIESALVTQLGSYYDTTTEPPTLVGKAFWQGADIPNEYQVSGLEAILQFADFIRDPNEFEDFTGVQGTASYRLRLTQHGRGQSVEEALYTVLALNTDYRLEAFLHESDLAPEQVTVIIPERISRP